MSIMTAFPFIQEGSDATPGLFNRMFSQLSDNLGAVNQSVVGGINFSGVSITVPSSTSDYLYFQDSLGQKSSYIIGSHVGGTADGLNIWDASGNTMIASFSKQSIRFYQNVVGPVFDVGGALANTLNAATFGTGADSKESRIQAAISAATAGGIARVYVPANLYPYSAASVVFSTAVQMVREGGAWDQYDLLAYGAYGDGIKDDRPALVAVDANGTGYAPRGTFKIGSSVTLTGYWQSSASGIFKPASGATLYLSGPYSAGAYQTLDLTSGGVIFNAGSSPSLVVEWVGAKADGATDSTSPLRSTISVAQNSSVKLVQFGPGIYVTNDLVISGNGVALQGSGPAGQYNSTDAATTIIQAKAGTVTVLNALPNGGTFADPILVQIKHLQVDGNSIAATGIYAGPVTTIEDVSVKGCTTAGIWLGQLTNSTRIIRSAAISNHYGLYIDGTGGSTTFSVTDSNFNLNDYGIYLHAGFLGRFTNCVVESNTVIGLYVFRPDVQQIGHMEFDNVWFEDNANGGGLIDTISFDAQTRDQAHAPFQFRFYNCRFNTSSNLRRYMLLWCCNHVRFINCSFAGTNKTDALQIQPQAQLISFEDCTWPTDGSPEAQFTDAWNNDGATRLYRTDSGSSFFYTPTLTNSWVTVGSTATPQYWHDHRGDVHMQGSVRSGTIGSSIFTLPLGARSMVTRSFAVSSNSAFGMVQIRPNGAVIPSVGTIVDFNLDGVVFSTASS